MTIETTSYMSEIGSGASLAIDTSGHAHVAYIRTYGDYYGPDYSCLKHACWDGSGWQIEGLVSDGRYGSETALDLDSDGQPAIAYAGLGLSYAAWDGSVWVIDTIQGGTVPGYKVSLAFDSDDIPHLCFIVSTTSNSGIMHASRGTLGWSIETIEEIEPSGHPLGHDCSLALDYSDTPHVSFYKDGTIYSGQREDTGWSIELVDAAGGWGDNSLAVDAWGRRRISYSSNGQLRYALKCLNGSWSITTIDQSDETGCYSSIAVDHSCRPHIGYTRGPDLMYAWRDEYRWNIEHVEEADDVSVGGKIFGYNVSLALDGSGSPYLVYSSLSYGQLPEQMAYSVRFAWKDESGWETEYAPGKQYPSLVIDRAGTAHFSYCTYGYHGSIATLGYAHCSGLPVSEEPFPVVESLALSVLGPCPSDGEVWFELSLPSSATPDVAFYDLVGHRVGFLEIGYSAEGKHLLSWNGIDQRGQRAPSGTYILSAEAGGQRVSERVVLLR